MDDPQSRESLVRKIEALEYCKATLKAKEPEVISPFHTVLGEIQVVLGSDGSGRGMAARAIGDVTGVVNRVIPLVHDHFGNMRGIVDPLHKEYTAQLAAMDRAAGR